MNRHFSYASSSASGILHQNINANNSAVQWCCRICGLKAEECLKGHGPFLFKERAIASVAKELDRKDTDWRQVVAETKKKFADGDEGLWYGEAVIRESS